MGESTCVMHAFSYPSSISNEAQEDNPIYALEESVSLGRFMTETLSWEKWSSFSRNRYVEEAEMYSRPGSVKQKKAYFEAHFKRMAALKAAALLEQANSTQVGGGAPDPPKSESQAHINDGININEDDDAGLHVQDTVLSSPPSILDQQWIEKEDENLDRVANYNEDESNDEVFEVTDHNEDGSNEEVIEEADQAEHNEDESNDEVIEEADQADYNDDGLKEYFMDVEEQNQTNQMECDLANKNESCVEEDVFHECVVEKEAEDSGFVADHTEDDPDEVEDEPSLTKIIEDKEQAVEKQNPSTELETSFVADHHEGHPDDGEDEPSLTKISEEKEQVLDKQNPTTEMETNFVKRDESRLECSTVKKQNPSTETETSLECSSVIQDAIPPATSPRSKQKPTSPAFIPSTPMGKRNPKLSLYMPSVEGDTTSLASSSSPAKSVAQQPAAVHPGKENTFTPIGRKSWINDPDKKRTPLRMSINRELNRFISPVIKKIGSSSKTSNKDWSTPLKTAAKASVDGMRNDRPQTPQSGRRRARALFDGSIGVVNKPAGSRWPFLSTEGSKSPAGGRNKTSSPIIPKSFCLNGSRAPRRKERLEEKFNAKATESIQQKQQQQQQSKVKEKPNELTKLRNSFCFGAKLSSESFRERKEQIEIQTEKTKGTDCKLPKKGGSRLQNMTSLPPRKSGRRELRMSGQKKADFASSKGITE